MRISDSELARVPSNDSMSVAGPSTISMNASNGGTSTPGADMISISNSDDASGRADAHTNGHAFGNGHSTTTNGLSNGALKQQQQQQLIASSSSGSGYRMVQRVDLPGTKLYDDAYIDREEFVRLVVQSLRDVGYSQTASTLEAESGYVMESNEATEFRHYILNGDWEQAESSLYSLGVTDEQSLHYCRFLISKQKYLELLEAQDTMTALRILRSELAPLSPDNSQLQALSSLIMCTDVDDLRARAQWEGARNGTRTLLLEHLQDLIPPSTMLPDRRFTTLIEHAFAHQRTQCLYHNAPYLPESYSLYSDHFCSRESFPTTTTSILAEHTSEVWNLQWNHDGRYLATASKDKSVIIWRFEPDGNWSLVHKLGDHQDAVNCVSWSLDDSKLLTSAEQYIKIWDTKTGECKGDVGSHTDTVTALEWLPDGTGFLSAGMDRNIFLWNTEGKQRETWLTAPIRITDLALTPDGRRLVIVGIFVHPAPIKPSSSQGAGSSSGAGSGQEPGSSQGASGDAGGANGSPSSSKVTRNVEHKMLLFDFATKYQEASLTLEGELTSVKVSQDSRFALLNHAPDEIQLWDLEYARLARKFTGQRQGKHVIRSCFGGVDGNFIVSGSEDRNIYIWHRDTGVLLENLSGHGSGSVNAVAWNPRDPAIFASCSDDSTVRIWEPLPPEYLDRSSVGAEVGVDGSSSLGIEENGKGKGKSRER